MADIRKEQEREELHKAIWSIADDLRVRDQNARRDIDSALLQVVWHDRGDAGEDFGDDIGNHNIIIAARVLLDGRIVLYVSDHICK